jgi:hypothetical protein
MKYQEREKDHGALNALETRQKENAKATQNMPSAIETGITTESTKSRLVELETERTRLKTGIAQQLIEELSLDLVEGAISAGSSCSGFAPPSAPNNRIRTFHMKGSDFSFFTLSGKLPRLTPMLI